MSHQAAKNVEHLKQALKEVSEEPGATIHVGQPAEHGKPSAPLQPPPGIKASVAERVVVAPTEADPGHRVDVVEAVGLSTGAEIRTDMHSGFGASAGPVRGKMASAAEEEKEKGGGGGGGGEKKDEEG